MVTISPEVRAKAREAVRPMDTLHLHSLIGDNFTDDLDAIINAILAEVVGPERVIVPREATSAMAIAGSVLVERDECWTFPQLYRAMISASQEDIQIKN